MSSFRGLRERCLLGEIDHLQRGSDALGGAVLEADHGIDRNRAAPAIDGFDVRVFLVDDGAADLSRARQLAVVGVELLVEQEEAEMRCATGSVALTASTSFRNSA